MPDFDAKMENWKRIIPAAFFSLGDSFLDFTEFLMIRRQVRRVTIFLLQSGIIALAFIFSFMVRFDSQIPVEYLTIMMRVLPMVMAVKLAVFWRAGLFGGWWSFVSLPDLFKIARAVLLSSLLLMALLVLLHTTPLIPRSILLLDALFCFLIMAGVRVFARILRENKVMNKKLGMPQGQRVLIVGAGAVGQTIAKEIRQNPNLFKHVIGYIDNDSERQRQSFQGIPVLGTVEEFSRIQKKYAPDLVIISPSAVHSRDLRQLVENCKGAKIESKILPPVADFISGKVSVQHIRDVEIEDLLGRKPVELEIEQIKSYLANKRILVTGAGGSIGSEICRQVASFSPSTIALFENSETPLFQIENELCDQFPRMNIQPLLCDVRDEAKVRSVFSTFRPDVIFHAAAYKHVPLSEINPEEVVRNNVLGTKIIADAADNFGADHFVLISTDKAVNPTNVMGASKRAAEIYVQNLSRVSSTKMVTVRFGNVLGSNGSVVPIFKEQIRKGGPVKVTHPEVTRFFMTISEAVQLVLQAGSMGKGGEIFLLDMGEPVKILHLAEEMIRLSGLRPHEEIEISFTGLRPGEKLYEELLLAGENVLPTRHEKIRILKAAHYDSYLLDEQMNHLSKAITTMDRLKIEKLILEMVPEFHRESEKVTHLPTAGACRPSRAMAKRSSQIFNEVARP